MSAIATKPGCVSCGQEIPVLKCKGCWQTTYSSQSIVQGQENSRQVDQAKTNQEISAEQKVKAQQHALIQQVDDWECDAMNEIRQTADEARRLILEHTTERISLIETKLTKLTEQLRQCHQENNFIPKHVSQWHEEMTQLTKQLVIPSRITVQQTSIPLVTKILLEVTGETGIIEHALFSMPNISVDAKWIQNGITVAGGNGQGDGLNQFSDPEGLYVDDDQTIYVADYSNHRIVEWKTGETSGTVVAGGNGSGNQTNQLSNPSAVIVDKETDSLIISDYNNKRLVRWPRQNGTNGETIISDITSYGLTMDSWGYLYVSDYNKHEVKRWKVGETDGIVVAGGNGQGNGLDQLSNPMHIFIDQDHSVYVSDEGNHRVMKWMAGAKEGIVVAGDRGEGNGLTQLSNPFGVVVDQLGTVYVAEYNNHRVTRWSKGTTQGSVVVGGNERGAEQNQFNNCWGLLFDRQGNLYVSDYGNHRVQKFNIDPNSIE